MLNEDKIRLMTKLASYEQGKGKKDLEISKYFKADYISLNMIKSFFSATIAYVFMLFIWLLFQMDGIMQNSAGIDFAQTGFKIVGLYIVFLVVYMTITRFVYARRFHDTRANLKEYNHELKHLERILREEDKAREEIAEGGNQYYDDTFNS